MKIQYLIGSISEVSVGTTIKSVTAVSDSESLLPVHGLYSVKGGYC